MRTVALTGLRKMEVIDVPEPEPKPGDLKLRVHYCGICGSDLHGYTGFGEKMLQRYGFPGEPWLTGIFSPIMGHEFSGEVVAVGPGVTGFEIGDWVVVNPGGQPCNECEDCRAGHPEKCQRRAGPGMHRAGAFAEYVITHAGTATKLPRGAEMDKVALSEPLAVSLWAVKRAGIQPGQSVLITGAGPIGALCVPAARRAGASRIFVSDLAPGRRAVVEALGAVALDPAKAPVALQIIGQNDGRGVDHALECAGVGAAMSDCLGSIHAAGMIDSNQQPGRVTVVSLFSDDYQLDMMRLMLMEQEIVGSYGSHGQMKEAIRLIVSEDVDVGPAIGPRISLEQVPATFADLTSGRDLGGKVLVHPTF